MKVDHMMMNSCAELHRPQRRRHSIDSCTQLLQQEDVASSRFIVVKKKTRCDSDFLNNGSSSSGSSRDTLIDSLSSSFSDDNSSSEFFSQDVQGQDVQVDCFGFPLFDLEAEALPPHQSPQADELDEEVFQGKHPKEEQEEQTSTSTSALKARRRRSSGNNKNSRNAAVFLFSSAAAATGLASPRTTRKTRGTITSLGSPTATPRTSRRRICDMDVPLTAAAATTTALPAEVAGTSKSLPAALRARSRTRSSSSSNHGHQQDVTKDTSTAIGSSLHAAPSPRSSCAPRSNSTTATLTSQRSSSRAARHASLSGEFQALLRSSRRSLLVVGNATTNTNTTEPSASNVTTTATTNSVLPTAAPANATATIAGALPRRRRDSIKTDSRRRRGGAPPKTTVTSCEIMKAAAANTNAANKKGLMERRRLRRSVTDQNIAVKMSPVMMTPSITTATTKNATWCNHNRSGTTTTNAPRRGSGGCIRSPFEIDKPIIPTGSTTATSDPLNCTAGTVAAAAAETINTAEVRTGGGIIKSNKHNINNSSHVNQNQNSKKMARKTAGRRWSSFVNEKDNSLLVRELTMKF